LGRERLERQTTVVEVINSAVPLQPRDFHLAPGASSSRYINLTELFTIATPGKYTVIAEHASVMNQKAPERALNAVKTSFVIMPRAIAANEPSSNN
jgi:hypothetical protein